MFNYVIINYNYLFSITVNFVSGLSYATPLYGRAVSQVRLI